MPRQPQGRAGRESKRVAWLPALCLEQDTPRDLHQDFPNLLYGNISSIPTEYPTTLDIRDDRGFSSPVVNDVSLVASSQRQFANTLAKATLATYRSTERS